MNRLHLAILSLVGARGVRLASGASNDSRRLGTLSTGSAPGAHPAIGASNRPRGLAILSGSNPPRGLAILSGNNRPRSLAILSGGSNGRRGMAVLSGGSNRRLLLAVVSLAGALAMAACGGGSPAASSVPSIASAPSGASAAAASAGSEASGSSTSAAAKPAGSPSAQAGSSASAKPAASAPVSGSASAKPAASGPATAVTLALGYIPDIQFAPFYVAQAKGFYKDQGIDISFDNGISPDLIKAVGAGKFKFALSDPDTVVSAREQSIPVTYVAALYPQAPTAIISLPKAGITQPAQLKGKKVGLPGRYGSSYIGLLGVLNKAGLSEKDVDLQEIGFNQPPQLLAGKVDAVVGFANNDAVKVQAQAAAKPNVILIADQIPFIGNGIITNDDTMKGSDKLVQGIVHATLLGMQYTAAHQDEAFQITTKVVPEAGGQNARTSQDVLAASVPLWKDKGTAANGLGYTDPAAWKAMEDVMAKAGIVKSAPAVDQLVTNKYISKDIQIAA